jgi:hypothetical protein
VSNHHQTKEQDQRHIITSSAYHSSKFAMKHFACAAILAASANIVRAQIGIDCDGAHYPNYEDCESSSTMTFNRTLLT